MKKIFFLFIMIGIISCKNNLKVKDIIGTYIGKEGKITISKELIIFNGRGAIYHFYELNDSFGILAVKSPKDEDEFILTTIQKTNEGIKIYDNFKNRGGFNGAKNLNSDNSEEVIFNTFNKFYKGKFLLNGEKNINNYIQEIKNIPKYDIDILIKRLMIC